MRKITLLLVLLILSLVVVFISNRPTTNRPMVVVTPSSCEPCIWDTGAVSGRVPHEKPRVIVSYWVMIKSKTDTSFPPFITRIEFRETKEKVNSEANRPAPAEIKTTPEMPRLPK